MKHSTEGQERIQRQTERESEFFGRVLEEHDKQQKKRKAATQDTGSAPEGGVRHRRTQLCPGLVRRGQTRVQRRRAVRVPNQRGGNAPLRRRA